MRGATVSALQSARSSNISIHAPHARSDGMVGQAWQGRRGISIHAPHARSDHLSRRRRRPQMIFQSTLLMRGATMRHMSSRITGIISIHAPHARSDRRTRSNSITWRYFNPRSSCEERRGVVEVVSSLHRISIHAPHARSDRHVTAWRVDCTLRISIHAPHARSDRFARREVQAA